MSRQSQPDSGPTATSKLKLNAPRLIAGTLAAVTGAALSSRLGVTGTLVGTGVISLVSGTAATVYEHSVERGRAAVRNHLSALEDNGALRRLRPVRAESADETGTLRYEAVDGGKSGPGRLRTAAAGLLHSPGRRWAMAAAGAVATFVVALGIITVIEVAHGSSLSGTGHRTTLGQAFSGSGHSGPRQEHRPPTPSGSPASSSPPSVTPSPGPSASENPSSSPSRDTPSSSAPAPSATPSQQTTQAPTTTTPPTSQPSLSPTTAPSVPSPQPSN